MFIHLETPPLLWTINSILQFHSKNFNKIIFSFKIIKEAGHNSIKEENSIRIQEEEEDLILSTSKGHHITIMMILRIIKSQIFNHNNQTLIFKIKRKTFIQIKILIKTSNSIKHKIGMQVNSIITKEVIFRREEEHLAVLIIDLIISRI
jgi:hypothetical protein